MATMVKEKRRPKSKTKKEKSTNEIAMVVENQLEEQITLSTDNIATTVNSLSLIEAEKDNTIRETKDIKTNENQTVERDIDINLEVNTLTDIPIAQGEIVPTTSSSVQMNPEIPHEKQKPESIETSEHKDVIASEEATAPESTENEPSAPVFHEPQILTETPRVSHQVASNILKALPLEEAVKVYCEREMANVKTMSEKEETLVQAGPISGPEHPLVDLLSTFKRSLSAVERVRNTITCAFYDEEKFRKTLWQVTKRDHSSVEQCSCGADVLIKIRFEVAVLRRQDLPVARRKLDNILREVQENYCHHQHAALLSHSQIEDLLIEIMNGNMSDIREALALILQALRFSDSGPPTLAVALTRWATALSTALDTSRDIRHLLFLIHHLFRQSHSVRWAASALRMSCNDSIQASRAIMLLDLLLNKPKFEVAKECSEVMAEDWEEVDKSGSTGAVAEGSLRERDLLALVAAFPLREIAARLLTCEKADISTISEHDLIDPYGGHNILKCCFGTRTLIAVIQKAITSNSSYRQLRNELTHIAAKVAEGLAQLHLYMLNNNTYKPHISLQVTAELDDIFSSLRQMLFPDKLDILPTSLMTDDNAMKYCNELISDLHGVESRMSCVLAVDALCSCSCARAADHNLATTVLRFLIQNGLCKNPNPCKLGCASASRECIAKLLESHPYMQTIVLHMLADLSQTNTIDPVNLSSLCVDRWRPQATELNAVLQTIAASCPKMLEHLLLQLEYTPNVGISLEAQLTIGSFLCDWLPLATPPGPDWPWVVLRKLRPHRTSWNLSLDVPPPDKEEGLFAIAFALLSSSWGHCIPLICTKGVSALVKLAMSRPEMSVHCLAPVMLVMQDSPESISLTKEFGELFEILLNTGPSLVQRALGVGGPTGVQLLQELILEQLANTRYGDKSSIVTAWLHALWRAGAGPGLGVADAAVRSCRHWTLVDHFLNNALQDPSSPALISSALCCVARAPLLAECAVRTVHAQQLHDGTFPLLCTAVHNQRLAGHKINVDNALKQIGSTVKSEDLCIYKCSTCVLAAPAHHPAHLTLWRMMLHLYLQRPPDLNETTPPVGPLFFSGYYKSRVLSQLQKRLQEHITYHHNQYQIYKQKCQSHPRNVRPTVRRKTTPVKYDDNILPSVSIGNLTGDSDDGESDGGDELERDNEQVADTSEIDRLRRDEMEMQNYHLAAEKMLNEYARWLDEGEQTRAHPFHADIARFLSEMALDTAWRTSVQSIQKQEHVPSIPFPQQKTQFEILRDSLMSIKTKRKRRHIVTLRSTLEDLEVSDARTLLSLVVKHLSHLENMAREWTIEANHITALDNQLLQLVGSLRVPKTLPPMTQRCPNNCKPITKVFSVQEWCVCVNTERAIVENRSTALAAMKMLARPRTHSVNTIAALHSLARRIRSSESARRVLEAAYKSAAHVHNCALAQDLITDLVDQLADRWITQDGTLCSEMLTSWWKTNNSLQQHFCVALVDPRKLNTDHWLTVYLTVARSKLPSHVVFSLLSKFDISRWADSASDVQRWSVLETLLQLLQTWGPQPHTDTHVLLELCGVQCTSCVRTQQLCDFVKCCARAVVRCTLAVKFLSYVAKMCSQVGPLVGMDQLGYLLRELGAIWWEARTNKTEARDYTLYAAPIAHLLTVLQRVFVRAAVDMSYEPERVGHYSWCTIQESWSPWLTPHCTPPLLAATSDASAALVNAFRDMVAQVMLDCPGTEVQLLRYSFCWITQLRLSSEQQQDQVVVTSLMWALASLPWTQHQWIDHNSIQAAVQVVNSSDSELKSWSVCCWKYISAECWLSDADDLVARLVAILHIFTAKINVPDQIVSVASVAPWLRLPAAALEAALLAYYSLHYNLCVPYHTNTQFTVLLYASGLRMSPSVKLDAHMSATLQQSREMFVSHWTRVMYDTSLIAHVAGQQNYLLQLIKELAPCLEPLQTQSLLCRAVVVMCVEPAAAAAAPVWVSWLSSANKQLLEASLSAVCSLTTWDYFAIVAEAAVKAYMNLPEGSWQAVCARWSRCACAVEGRGGGGGGGAALGVQYVLAHTHAHTHAHTRAALLALRAADLHFAQNELIIAVYICYACRVASQCLNSEDPAQQDCLAAARALMTWADEKKSLLSTLGLQGQRNVPTDSIRLLCRLAQCVLDPNNESFVRAYESCCSSVLGSSSGDVSSWGRLPHTSKLVRLAMRLFPNHDRYFQNELDLLK